MPNLGDYNEEKSRILETDYKYEIEHVEAEIRRLKALKTRVENSSSIRNSGTSPRRIIAGIDALIIKAEQQEKTLKIEQKNKFLLQYNRSGNVNNSEKRIIKTTRNKARGFAREYNNKYKAIARAKDSKKLKVGEFIKAEENLVKSLIEQVKSTRYDISPDGYGNYRFDFLNDKDSQALSSAIIRGQNDINRQIEAGKSGDEIQLN